MEREGDVEHNWENWDIDMHIRYVYINMNVQNVKMCRFWMWHLGASFLFPFKWCVCVCACVAGNESWVLQQNGALNPHAETTQHQGWVVSKIFYFNPDPAVHGNQKSGEKEPPGMLLKPCTSWEKLPFPQLVSLPDFWSLNSIWGNDPIWLL